MGVGGGGGEGRPGGNVETGRVTGVVKRNRGLWAELWLLSALKATADTGDMPILQVA